MKIGIFSGSFNPIHIGHLILANYITEFTDIDEVWLVISPQNPLKKHLNLADENERFDMVKIATTSYPKLKACDFEFSLPRPSYTISTLDKLKETYPENTFCLIIGADNWENFHQWKDYQTILNHYPIYIYPRLGYSLNIDKSIVSKSISILDTPIIEISSTFIRNSLLEKKNIKSFLPEGIFDYIQNKELYK